MKYAEMYTGMYVVRTRDLSWARVLSGNICYVDGVTGEELHLHITEDCVPKGSALAVPKEADDGHWYDVSELVMQANSCITPSLSECVFTSAVAPNYRNFLGLGSQVPPYALEDSVGHICLIGEHVSNNVIFAKNGYFVVGCDSNGYVIVYQGYCDFLEDDEPRKLNLRVLNLRGTARDFYPAEPIVSACCAAYAEDCALADQYRQDIREDTIVSSTDSILSAGSSDIERLSLEAAVC